MFFSSFCYATFKLNVKPSESGIFMSVPLVIRCKCLKSDSVILTLVI